MQPTHDNRVADLIGDLIELSTALADLHRDGAATDEETLTVCEEFEHVLRFKRLTNNLRDGWRISEAVGLPGCVSSPATAEEVRAAAPFARLLHEADELLGRAFDFDKPDADDLIADLLTDLQDALGRTVAALADLIAGLIAGRVTLPPLLDGDAAAAAEAEGVALCDALQERENAYRAALDAAGAL